MYKWKPKFSKEQLIKLIEQNLTIWQISKILKVDNRVIKTHFKKFSLAEKLLPKLDYTNYRFGKIVCLENLGRPKKNSPISWKCQCDCGNIFTTNIGYLENRKIEGCRKCYRGNLIGTISKSNWNRIKKMARYRNKEFTITREYAWKLFLRQDKKCIYSGLELTFFTSSVTRHNTTASLDRIDSSKGYIEGNVQWVHKKINMMKQSMSEIEFLNFCTLIVNYKKIGVNQ